MIGLMGVLTSIISWLICIFAVIASIAITVVLWLTYFDVRKTQDAKIKYSYFEEFLRNETMIYAMAIIATVIMVRPHLHDFHRFGSDLTRNQTI